MERKKQFLIISIIPRGLSENDALKDLREVKSLIESVDGILVDLLTQSREVHDKGSFIGNGKIIEAADIIKQKNIDVVILNGIIKPGHIHEMKSIFYKKNKNIEVWDRVDLILHIFAKNAHTKEAKLQIELAAMKHMGPRIYGMGMVLSRQTGGIGTRGIGETNTELMKRHWHERIKKVKEKLKKLATERQKQLDHRKRLGMKTISIVGYTNAGKTSLFNLLTKKNKLVDDSLFVTLDSSVGKIYLADINSEILISDTIGFMKGLPLSLIDAFKSTLFEAIQSDLILHVIDVSDEEIIEKILVVEKILKDLNLGRKRKIFVLNKSDLLTGNNRTLSIDLLKRWPTHQISARNAKGIKGLLSLIKKELAYADLLREPLLNKKNTEIEASAKPVKGTTG